jgi:hypothetical protein
MKKYIISAVILLAVAVPTVVFGFTPATLINGASRVAVFSQEQAQRLFAEGYKLEGINPLVETLDGLSKRLTAVETYIENLGAVVNSLPGLKKFGGNTFNASSTLYIARTFTAKEVCNNATLTVNGSATDNIKAAASLDMTLPATSTLFTTCLRNEGDEVTFDFINQSPTAASTTEIIEGTGCEDIIGIADGDATFAGQSGGTITIKRVHDYLADGGSKDCVVKIWEWN